LTASFWHVKFLLERKQTRKENKQMETGTMDTHPADREPEKPALEHVGLPCDHANCNYVATGRDAATRESQLRMHKARKHGKMRGQPRTLKARLAAKARKRGVRLDRDVRKQREWGARNYARTKAARKMLGLTIEQFAQLSKAERAAAVEKANRPTAKAATVVAPARNGVVPTPDRIVRWCPGCGWNIDATRKAQAIVDGRVG
jgi:hypothetical protein